MCGEKEKLGRRMDVQLEEEKEQVNGVKYACFYIYQKHRLHSNRTVLYACRSL